jgi:hypothetical protein
MRQDVPKNGSPKMFLFKKSKIISFSGKIVFPFAYLKISAPFWNQGKITDFLHL